MIKKYALVLIVFLFAFVSGYGQILTFDFSGLAGSEATADSNFNDANLSASTISRGAGLTASGNGDRFNATSWALTSIANAVSGNDYMEFTITPNATYSFDITTIDINFQRSGTGTRGIALRSSIDGYIANIDTEKVVLDNTTVQTFTFTVNHVGNSAAVTYRVYGWAESTGGSGGFEGTGNDIIINGSVTTVSTSDLSISGTPTNHGSTCVNTAATSVQYTITNNAAITTALNVAVASNDTQFAISGLSTTTIAPSGTATFNVVFTPTATGAQAATITVSSTTITDDATIDLTGTGLAVATQAVTSNAATLVAGTTATINGNVTTLGTCPDTTQKGFVYSETATNATPTNLGTGVTTTVVGGLTTGAYNLGLTGLNAGTQYSFRAFVNNGATYTYGAVLTFTTTTPPANDLCSGAIDLTPNSSTCTFASYTNVNATDSGETASSCNGYSGGDVWFSVVVPMGGEISIEASDNGDFTDGVMALYSGTCGALTEITCDDDSGPGIMPYINATGLAPGSTVFIRFWEYNNNDFGTFNICVTRPDTTIEFTSPTFTTNENGTSINLCVGITNPSATVATTADVTLVSSNSPHLTYTTSTVTFPAGSSAQQCVNIPITDNGDCGDSKNYAFDIENITGGNTADFGGNASAILSIIDDEGTSGTMFSQTFDAGSNWTYTEFSEANEATFAVVNTLTNINFSNISGNFWGINDANDEDSLVFDSVNTTGMTNMQFSFDYDVFGFDDDDDMFYRLYFNGVDQGKIQFIDGFSNYSEEGTITIPIPDGTTSVAVTLYVDQNGGSDYAAWDNIMITGDICPTCTPTHTVTGFTPNTGPGGSEVTINGTGFTVGTTVSYGGSLLTIISQIATELVVEIPTGATTGAFTIEEASCPIESTDFTIIKTNGSCNALDDLIMTEIYDASSGSLGYIEIYNGTGATIDLTTYYIRRYGDASRLAANVYTDYSFTPSETSIANGQVLYGKISTDTDTASPDFIYTASGGGVGINGDDIFHLRNGATVIDVFVEPNGDTGYVSRRNVNTAGPNNISNPSDWSHLSTENETNLGVFAFTGGTSNYPTVTTHPLDVLACANQAEFTTVASSGNSGTLTYSWYFNNGSDLGWTIVNSANLPLATVSGETTNVLTLTNGFTNYSGYQFYCVVTEDGACNIASDAAQLKIETAIWTSTGWSSPPTLSKIAIINEDYNTSIGTNGETNFSACQLVINATHKLTIADNTFVEVENNTIVNGDLMVETHGAFVQNADLTNGFTINSGGNALVNKTTTFINNWYDYTYWSSPIVDETVGDALDIAPANRRFWFNAQNYLDEKLDSTDNLTNGSDDIDDNGDDWQVAPAAAIMTPGVGYAATVLPIGFMPASYQATFEGAFNNGVITTPIYINTFSGDNDWNLIGNPYPSAIDFDDVHALNSSLIDGAAYLWSHASPPDSGNDGNQVLNFNKDDYAIITIGSGNTAGNGTLTDNNIPNSDNTIPSGQGFFVRGLANGSLTFNNSMRKADVTSNSQFFRNSSSSNTNRLWLNLTTDNGAFNQILIAYVDGATNAFDGFSYDAPRNLSSGNSSVIYTEIEGEYRKFAIQGKEPNDLDLDEIIPFGFYTNIAEATLYTISIPQLEGEFLTNNTVYLHDKFMNIFHDLNASNYSFTSETGEFNDRFQIVFRPQPLSIDENEYYNALTIIEQQDGSVKFSISNSLQIKNVKIYDVLGRLLYNLKGTSSTETYSLDTLSQATYLAKVTLSNGVVVTKKAIKRK